MKGFSRMGSHAGLEYLDQLEVWKGAGGFGLDKIRRVLSILGDPQDAVRSIHVTGTNGKGTVATVVSSILAAAGFRVGMNISPHLEQLNERIIIDGLPIDANLIGDFALKLKEASESVDTILSFHEAITAVSFLAFRELKVDWMVIEVGLGGRLDASNVIRRPEVSVITSIDLDHQLILGDTKPKIAIEKAGIIKYESPVVIGPLDVESAKEVRLIAAEKNSAVYALHEQFNYISIHDADISDTEDTFDFSFGSQAPITIKKRIRGRHQVDNFCVALATAKLLGVDDQSCIVGASNAFWPSRLEVFNWKNRVVVMDCAHNPHGIRALVDNLQNWGIEKVEMVFGVLDTKDWQAMIDMLAPFSDNISLLTPESERALDMSAVVRYLSSIGIRNTLYGRDIKRFIQDQESKRLPLLMTGSIYLIGELRKHFGVKSQRLWIKH
jgi:dihydrofolate synthase/folylpolyglutamate synthase